MEPLIGTFHDAIKGETIVRELTADEYTQYLLAIEGSKGLYPTVVEDSIADEPVADEPVADETVVDESVVE